MDTSPGPHRRRTQLTIAFWVVLGLVAALLLFTAQTPGHSLAHPAGSTGPQQAGPEQAGAQQAGATQSSPHTTAPSSSAAKPADVQRAITAAYEFGHRRDYRVDIAVTDLESGKTWGSGDRGYFGTGSVVKTMVAAKMSLTGAMHGADAAEAFEMITRSDDDACNDLWGRFGQDQIITWLSTHYRQHFGEPNRRPGFWGNTLITARSLTAFYRAVSHDPAVGPWLVNAMAHTERIAADGTDQYFGIPRAGGGHTVKQGWGTASAGDGYIDDAVVNSTGIVTVGGHRYAIAILTEGDHNVSAADDRGYVHAQGDVVTQLARMVLAALRVSAP